MSDTITVRHGDTFEARLTGAPTGLVGTLRFSIRDDAGGVALAATTTGIAEDPAGSGSYIRTTSTTALAAGSYSIQWDTGTVSPTTVAYQALTVTDGAPDGTELVTLAEVKAAMEIAASDTSRDALIASLIPAASAALCGGQFPRFVPTETGASHSFSWERGTRLDVAPYMLRNVTSVAIGTEPVTSYRAEPVDKPDGVYTHLRFDDDYLPETATTFGRYTITVTGDWGAPLIPEVVKRACIVTVQAWMAAELAAIDYGDIDDPRIMQPRGPRSHAIPNAAWHLMFPYQRHGVA